MTPDLGAGASDAPARGILDGCYGSHGGSGKRYYRAGPFTPELGGDLEDVTLAYETWGRLNAAGDNAVLVAHALTGDSHAAGEPDAEHKRGGWWEAVIGSGRLLDTDRYFVVCVNVLGGCGGSTGPASVNPETGEPYGMRFPLVTIQDMVRSQKLVLDALGVERLALVIGGSIGGQQALEWAVHYPDLVEKAVPVAATGALGPQGLAMSELGRRAIMADPDWQGGDYYDTGREPTEGLALARMAGMVTYQSPAGQWERFGRGPASRPALYPELGGRFEVESYLHYQGAELARRFDANSYLYLTRAMDLYDVAAGYESAGEAYARIRARTLFVGISSDWLFYPGEVRETAEAARGAGADARYAEIPSDSGHDAFLKDWDELDVAVRPFVEPGATENHDGLDGCGKARQSPRNLQNLRNLQS